MPRGRKRRGYEYRAHPHCARDYFSPHETDAIGDRRSEIFLTAEQEDELLFGDADERMIAPGTAWNRTPTVGGGSQYSSSEGLGSERLFAPEDKASNDECSSDSGGELLPTDPNGILPETATDDEVSDEICAEETSAPDASSDRVALRPQLWEKEEGVFKFLNPMKLYGFMLRTGSVRIDNRAYEMMRAHATLFSGKGNMRKLRSLRWELSNPRNLETPRKPLFKLPLSRGVRMLPCVRTVNRGLRDMYLSLTLPVSMFRAAVDTSKSGAISIMRRSDKVVQGLSDNATRAAASRTTRVALVKPSEYVRADVLSRRIFDLKMSTARTCGENSGESIDDNLFVHGRNVLYGCQPSMDAIHPLEKGWLDAAQNFASSDGTWKWTKLRVGGKALVHFDRTIWPEFCANLAVCDACRTRGQDKASTPGFSFEMVDAVAMSAGTCPQAESGSRVAIGHVQSMWIVRGTSSWENVNTRLRSVSRDGYDVKIISGAPHSVRQLSDLLYVASIADTAPGNEAASLEAASGTTAGHSQRCRRSVHGNSLPWSPLKPGDTVSILSLPDSSTRQCLCGTPVWSKENYLLLVNRWWVSPGDIVRQAMLIRDIDSVVRTIEANARDESMSHLCPYGAIPRIGGGFDTVFKCPLQSNALQSGSVAAQMRLVAIAGREECGLFTAPSGGESTYSGTSIIANQQFHEEVEKSISKEAPTYGILEHRDDGDHLYYFVERMYLYHDGFNDKIFRPDSVIGIYMGSLNLPAVNRRCSAHVRVLSLCPPGTDVAAIYSAVLDDIFEGAVNGVDCMTSDGKKVKVYLDLMFVLADTPAVKEVLDVPGHTALHPCHLCNYSTPSEVGGKSGLGKNVAAKTRRKSRYTKLDAWGSLTANSRNTIVHEAIRDSGASDAELRDCGISPLLRPASAAVTTSPTNTSDLRILRSTLPLHDYASRYNRAAGEGRLPKDHTGREILPQIFCPYRCMPPAPEHLFHNMFKYSLEFALKMLRSSRDAKAVELYMQMYQRMCGMNVQNHVVSIKDRELVAMTTSETYALSVVADRALLAVVDSPSRVRIKSHVEEKGLREAIRLVQSAARIIAFFWTKRELLVEVSGGAGSAEFVRLVETHVRMIHDLCKAPEDGTHLQPQALQNSSETRGRGRKIRRTNRNSSVPFEGRDFDESETQWPPDETARSYIDKPYVHRLLELAKSYFPFIGHGTLIAELPSESRHQPSKKLLKKFVGNLEPHVLAMEAAVGDDYKARLCCEIENACTYPGGSLEGDGAIRCLVRYLFGREALARMPEEVDSSIRLRVQNVIGVNRLLPTLLSGSSRALVSGQTKLTIGAARENIEPQWKRAHAEQEIVVNGGGLGEEVWQLVSKAENESRAAPMVVSSRLGKVVRSRNGESTRYCVGSGVNNFLKNIHVGSVITCRVRVVCDEDTQSGPFIWTAHQSSADSAAAQDVGCRQQKVSEEFQVRYFCVLGLYTADAQSRFGSAAQPQVLDTIQAVVVPVVDSEGEPVVATNRATHYRPVRAQTTLADAVRSQSSDKLWPDSIVTLDASDTSIKPVAVLPCCERTVGCGAYRDTADKNPEIRHGPLCGAQNGGKFFIRDELTGFPPRTA